MACVAILEVLLLRRPNSNSFAESFREALPFYILSARSSLVASALDSATSTRVSTLECNNFVSLAYCLSRDSRPSSGKPVHLLLPVSSDPDTDFLSPITTTIGAWSVLLQSWSEDSIW